jgi:hypothetical protein
MEKKIFLYSTVFIGISLTAYFLYKNIYKGLGTDKLKTAKTKKIEIEIKKENQEVEHQK